MEIENSGVLSFLFISKEIKRVRNGSFRIKE
jgi:hypothetical protein